MYNLGCANSYRGDFKEMILNQIQSLSKFSAKI